MKPQIICLIAVAIAGCATRFGTSAPGEIVFASERGGNTDIYSARTDGSDLRRITTDPAVDQFPRCSPDGRFIVFVRDDTPEGRGGLFRIDRRDGSERQLTRNIGRDSTPEWSADGASIYFTRKGGPYDRLARINADGTGLRFLTDGTTHHDVMPGISPDGRRLVHHTYRYGKDTELQLIDLATGEAKRLTESAGRDYEATFAGNDRVVFSSNRDGGHYRLYVLNLADRAVRQLADTGQDVWGARSSRAANSVMFYTGSRGSWRTMRVDLEGGTPVAMLGDDSSNFGGDWCSPR